MDALQEVMKEDRVCLSRVRPPEEYDFRVLDFAVGVRTPPTPNTVARPATLRSVSRTVTNCRYYYFADHDTSELLGHEVHLIRGLGSN